MFAVLREGAAEKQTENSAFWVDFQSPLGYVSCSHTHTPAHHLSSLMKTHNTSESATVLKQEGVLSFLIKSQRGSFLPTHSSLSRSFLELRISRTAQREVWWVWRNRWACISPYQPSSHTTQSSCG